MHRIPTLMIPGLFLMSLPLIGGCANDTGPAGSDAPVVDAAGSGAPQTIGYSALTLTNPFFKVIADAMQEEAEKHGYTVIVESAEQDVVRQADQINEFIVQGVTAIVLNPADSESIGQAIRLANEAGIPVFTNDIKYAGDVGEVVCHIATDNLQGGRLAGEAVVNLLATSGGNVGIIDYPDVESCQLRTKGFREVIADHNATAPEMTIEIVSVLNGRGARETGYSVAQDMISANSDLAAIFAINDLSALGAWSALDEAGLADRVPIIGFDGTRAGKQAIRDGKLLCDPVQFPDQMGRRTVEVIAKYFDGEEIPDEELIPSKLYYREDAETDPELQAVE